MLVIWTRCAYDRLTGDANSWASMTSWRTKKDVTTAPADTKTKDAGKTAASAKRKTQPATGRTRRSSGAMTQRMKDYKQTLAPEDSNNDDGDDEVKVIIVNDENADPPAAPRRTAKESSFRTCFPSRRSSSLP